MGAFSLFKLVTAGLLVFAVILHVVGFATDQWIAASMDSRGISGVMSANNLDMGSMGQAALGQMGMDIHMGLWRYCMKVQGMPMSTDMSVCQSPESDDVPGWMKGVRALGILSMIAAVVGLALLIYSIVGYMKGDRARLLPYFIVGACAAAALLLLIGVIIFGAEYVDMMADQMDMFKGDPSMADLGQNVKDHTHLGYSFALDHTHLGYSFTLEVIAMLMFIGATLMVVIPTCRGMDGAPDNLAV